MYWNKSLVILKTNMIMTKMKITLLKMPMGIIASRH
ncbi:UNVERIFIED_CONTAM: hypothetical protein GTU68_063414 [Idotea baltica]|nr:hypothetical protein [Idotea baltica]